MTRVQVKIKLHIAIIGATGLVGKTAIKVLDEMNFPFDKLSLFASERSKGEIVVNNNTYQVDTGNYIKHKPTEGAVKLAIKMLKTIKEVKGE